MSKKIQNNMKYPESAKSPEGKKLKIALIFGGQSGEHEVSLSSAISIMDTLNKEKYDITLIAITKKGNWLIGDLGMKYMKENKLYAGKEGAISIKQSEALVQEKNIDIQKIKEQDLIFPILHGPYGEDGKIQGFFDTLGVPYVFSGVLAHAIAMNKKYAKILAKDSGVPVCNDLVSPKGNYNIGKLTYPLIIKPLELGSSVGIQKAENEKELKLSLEDAWQYGDALLEEFKEGREFTITVMEDIKSHEGGEKAKVLAITEIIPLISDFYDYKAKYEDGGSRHVCPAKIDKDLEKNLKENAIKVFKSMGCKDLARIDFVMDKDNNIYFIDLNTIPGMTKTSLAPEAAQVFGLSFEEFLDKLIKANIIRNS